MGDKHVENSCKKLFKVDVDKNEVNGIIQLLLP